MPDAGEELNQVAAELERHALQLPRALAALVLAVMPGAVLSNAAPPLNIRDR